MRPARTYAQQVEHRNEYLEQLKLREELNKLNYEAVDNYRQTGQIPPISQVRDPRTVADILADSEKLKIDMVQTISQYLGSKQLGLQIVYGLLRHPRNVDNQLFIFAAQRMESIMEQVSKNHRYGFADSGETAQMIIEFIVSLYDGVRNVAESTMNFAQRFKKNGKDDIENLKIQLGHISTIFELIRRDSESWGSSKYLNRDDKGSLVDLSNELDHLYGLSQEMFKFFKKYSMETIQYLEKEITLNRDNLNEDGVDIEVILRMFYIFRNLPDPNYVGGLIKDLSKKYNLLVEINKKIRDISRTRVAQRGSLLEIEHKQFRSVCSEVKTIASNLIDLLNPGHIDWRNGLDTIDNLITKYKDYNEVDVLKPDFGKIGNRLADLDSLVKATGQIDTIDKYNRVKDFGDKVTHIINQLEAIRTSYGDDRMTSKLINQAEDILTMIEGAMSGFNNQGEKPPYSFFRRTKVSPEGGFEQNQQPDSKTDIFDPFIDNIEHKTDDDEEMMRAQPYPLLPPVEPSYEDKPTFKHGSTIDRVRDTEDKIRDVRHKINFFKEKRAAGEDVEDCDNQLKAFGNVLKSLNKQLKEARAMYEQEMRDSGDTGYDDEEEQQEPVYEGKPYIGHDTVDTGTQMDPRDFIDYVAPGKESRIPVEQPLDRPKIEIPTDRPKIDLGGKKPLNKAEDRELKPPKEETLEDKFRREMFQRVGDRKTEIDKQEKPASKEERSWENIDFYLKAQLRDLIKEEQAIEQKLKKVEEAYSKNPKPWHTNPDTAGSIPDIQSKSRDKFQEVEAKRKQIDEHAKKKPTTGSGIYKKRRGRVGGRGLNNDIAEGVTPQPRYANFGKYQINTKALGEGIFSIRYARGTKIPEHPNLRISKNFQNVLNKIIGGSIPTYDDYNSLGENERAYLYKVSQRADIGGKLSVPAPKKDAIEKEIHQFEVERGEILSGNNNKQLIASFKARLLKLEKAGALPRAEVNDVLRELFVLN